MADYLDEEKPIGYQYPEELESAIGPITPIETKEEREARLAAKRSQTAHFVPISPESATKIKQYWDEKGGDGYFNRPTTYLEEKFQGLVGKMFNKDYAPPVIPKKLDEWMDTSGDTPRVDYQALRLVGIPPEIKHGAMADVAQNVYGVAKKIALSGNDIKEKPDDTFPIRLGKTLTQTVDQFAGVFGSSVYEHLKSGGRFDDIYLPSVLDDEERTEIQNALSAGKPGAILRGGITVSLRPFQGAQQANISDVYDHVAKEKIKFVWDQINDATDTALTKDAALVANFIPVLGYLKWLGKAGEASKAVKAVSAVANPLTAATQALKGGKSLGLPALVGLSAAEAALMQRRHLSESAQQEELAGRGLSAVFGGGLTGALGAVGVALNKGSKAIAARRAETQNRAAQEVGKLVAELPPEQVHNIAMGLEDFPEPKVDFPAQQKAEGFAVPARPVVPVAADPQYVKEVKAGLIVHALDKEKQLSADPRIIQQVFTSLPHNKKLQDLATIRRQQAYGENPQQAKMRLALLNVLNQTEDSVAEGQTLIKKAMDKQLELPPAHQESIQSNVNDLDAISDLLDDNTFAKITAGTDQEFLAAVRAVAPNRAKAVELQLGRISDADLMQREFVDIFRALPPDKVTDVAAPRNSVSHRFLDSIHNWWDKRVKSQEDIDAVLDKSNKLGISVENQKVSSVQQLDSVITKIQKQTPVTGEGADIGHSTMLDSLASLRDDMEAAARNGTTIDPLHSTILAKDAKNFMDAGELEAIQTNITKFNELQEQRLLVHDQAAQILVDKVYMNRMKMGQKKDKISTTDVILQRLTSGKSADEIYEGLNQYFTKYARDMKIDPANLRDVTGDFKIVADSMAGGSSIPDAVINRFIVNSGRFIESVRPSSSGRLRRFGRALEQYNREAHWLDTVSDMIELGYDDPVKFAAQIVPRLGHIAEHARSSSLLRRFELLKAAGHDIYMKAMREIDLPETAKSQMYEAQAGGLTAKLRLAMNPNFVFRTESHIQNVFKATKEWDIALFKAMNDALAEAGITPNKEFLLGHFLTPHNNFDKSGYLLKLGIDAIGAEKWAKIWNRRKNFSNSKFSAIANFVSNTEYIMGTLNEELGRGLLHEEQAFAGGIKTATESISNNFKVEFSLLLQKLTREWAEPEFKYGFNKLQGSKGILAVNGFFYGFDNNTRKMINTPLGEWHRHAFIRNNAYTAQQIQRGDKVGFIRDTQKFLRNFKEYMDDDALRKQTASALWDYFYDAGGGPNNRTVMLDAQAWKSIWEYIQFQSVTLNKAYTLAAEAVANNNEKMKSLGYNIAMPDWRQYYVYEPSKNRYDLHEFTDRLFRDMDTTRWFGSSMRGQLEKAERIVLDGPSYENLAHPAQIIYDYVHHNLMSAHTIHSRTHLENFGMLIRDQGYINLSDWVMDLAQNKLRGSGKNEMFDGRTIAEQLENWLVTKRLTRAVTLLAQPAAVVLGVTRIANALNSPKSIIKNIVQASLESWIVRGPVKGLKTSMGTVYNTVKNYFWQLNRPLPNKPLPFESLRREVLEADARGEFISGRDISPGTAEAIYTAKRGLSDNYDRARLYSVQLMTSTVGEVPIPRRKGGLTRLALGARLAEDAMEDWVRKAMKERGETSISMAHLQLGGRIHDAALVHLYRDGTQKAYEYLMKEMPSMRKNLVWGFVTEMERGLKQGNPNFVTLDFLYTFHALQNGRFSPTAAPQLVRSPYIRSTLPQLFMFANAKALRPFRYLDLIRNIRGNVWEKSTSFMFKTRGMPSQMQKRMYLTLIPGLGIPTALFSWQFGLGSMVPESVADKMRENTEPGSFLRRWVEGSGYPLTEWGPLPGFFADTRSKTVPVGMTAALQNVAMNYKKVGEAVQSAWYHTMRSFGEVNDAWEDYLQGVPGVNTKLERLVSKRRAIMEIEDVNVREAEEEKINTEMLELQKHFEDTVLPKALDYIFANVPALDFVDSVGKPLSFLKVINTPFYRAHLEREALANDRLEADETAFFALNNAAIGGYTGNWSAAAAMLGLKGELGRIADANAEETKKRLMQEYEWLGESPESAEVFANLTFKLANWMDEEDLITMYGHQTYGEKVKYQDVIDRFLKAQKDYVRPEKMDKQQELSDVEALMLKDTARERFRRQILNRLKASEK